MTSQKNNVGDSYSEIIQPQDYNRIMTQEHLYIDVADRYILKTIRERQPELMEIVELGCGPARVLYGASQIETINLTGVDVDEDFLTYAKEKLKNTSVSIMASDIEHYQHPKPVDIFYSQGLHHHIAKGTKTKNYLANIYGQLRRGGYYIVGDEFIPNYRNDEEREILIVVWYAHIIAHAMRHGYDYLAQEEAKTLLDDLYEGRQIRSIKNSEQILFTLSRVQAIDSYAREGKLTEAKSLAAEFLKNLQLLHNLVPSNDSTIDLSRGDFKISDQAFRNEVEEIGFVVDDVKFFGPIETIGAMGVYRLRKG